MAVKPTQALIKYFKAKIIFLTLENYQALLWRIFQTGKFLWETAALSFTTPSGKNSITFNIHYF